LRKRNFDVTTYDEKSGFEETRVEQVASLARQPQHLAHVVRPEVTGGVVHVADVAEQFVRLDLRQPTPN